MPIKTSRVFYRRGIPNTNNFFGFNVLGNYSIIQPQSLYLNSNNNIRPILPDPPIINNIIAVNHGAIVNFSLGSNGSSPITDVQYSTNGIDYFSFNPPSVSSSGNISGLINNTTYNITIKSVTFYGYSKPSNISSIYIGYLLNELSNNAQNRCVCAFSPYLININYNGSIFVIRRDTDDLTTSVKITINNVYILLDGTLLSDWLNGSNAYIKTWLNQTPSFGNTSKTATQNTNALQPILDLSTNLIIFPNNCYFNLTNNTIPSNNSSYTFMVHHKNVDNPLGGFLGSGDYTNPNKCNTLCRNNNAYDNNWQSNDLVFGTYNDDNIIAVTYDGTIRRGYVNNVVTNVDTPGNRSSTATNNTLGVANPSLNTYLNGSIYSLFIFNNVISTTDMDILYNNI
jgi:hypothetical protein